MLASKTGGRCEVETHAHVIFHVRGYGLCVRVCVHIHECVRPRVQAAEPVPHLAVHYIIKLCEFLKEVTCKQTSKL